MSKSARKECLSHRFFEMTADEFQKRQKEQGKEFILNVMTNRFVHRDGRHAKHLFIDDEHRIGAPSAAMLAHAKQICEQRASFSNTQHQSARLANDKRTGGHRTCLAKPVCTLVDNENKISVNNSSEYYPYLAAIFRAKANAAMDLRQK